VLRLPIEERRKLLTEALRKIEYPVLQSMPFNVKPAELIRAAKELEIEGVIAKRNGSIYEPGRRSGAWVKYKLNCAEEFVIAGYTTGKPFDALIVGCYEAGNLTYVGKVRNGFVPHMRRELMAKMKPLKIDACPFANLPEKRRTQWALTREQMKDCVWLKPELVAQIEFTEWTPDGHLRHTAFAGLRQDKTAHEVVREPG